MSHKVSYVIPVYQNEQSLTQLTSRILKLFEDNLKNYELEIVFVNDGSTDGSLTLLKELKQKHPTVIKVVSFTRNFGQMAAILAGFDHVSGDYIINISADLQDPVELAVDLLKEAEKGAEVVMANRQAREDGWKASLTSKAAYYMIQKACPQIPDGGFDYYLVKKNVLDAFKATAYNNRFLQGDLLWFGYKTAVIPYIRQKRPFGRSQYNFSKRLKNFIDAYLNSTYLPIRAMSVVGILTSFCGIFYGFSVVVAKILDQTPFPGWAALAVIVSVIGGINMFMLGIIGEYIWRIYDEIKSKPNYVIQEII